MINDGDVVVCDFGGTMDGYCSDIRDVRRRPAHQAEVREGVRAAGGGAGPAVQASTVGTSCEEVEHEPHTGSSPLAAWASGSSTAPATASGSRRTRTPTWCPATPAPLEPGHASASSPGIYFPAGSRMRLEDIVVASADGPGPAEHRIHGTSRSSADPTRIQ